MYIMLINFGSLVSVLESVCEGIFEILGQQRPGIANNISHQKIFDMKTDINNAF